MGISVDQIKKLREQTGVGVADCRACLEACGGDLAAALKLLRQKSIEKADKKAQREVKAGNVFGYVHHNGRVGVLVSLGCETDFVARTDDFQTLGRELCLQVAASRPVSVEELLDQEYVRDPSQKVADLIKEVIGKLGENIQIIDFKVAAV